MVVGAPFAGVRRASHLAAKAEWSLWGHLTCLHNRAATDRHVDLPGRISAPIPNATANQARCPRNSPVCLVVKDHPRTPPMRRGHESLSRPHRTKSRVQRHILTQWPRAGRVPLVASSPRRRPAMALPTAKNDVGGSRRHGQSSCAPAPDESADISVLPQRWPSPPVRDV